MRTGIGDGQREASSSSTTNFSSLFSCGVPKLRIVMISNVRWLNRMPMESFQCLIRLTIMQDTKVESLGDVGGVLCSCSSSLKTLAIQWCSKLRRVMSGGLEHLTCLAELLINSCHSLRLSEGEEEQDLNNLTLLPKLETLKIVDCFELKAIPEWMPKLTSLKELVILDCSEELKERCQNPNGEDWSLIKHIPFVQINQGASLKQFLEVLIYSLQLGCTELETGSETNTDTGIENGKYKI